MKVQVIASFYLRKYTQSYESVASIEIKEGAKVKDLVAGLEVPEEDSFIVAVNGQLVPFNHILKDDDLVRIVPPVSGG